MAHHHARLLVQDVVQQVAPTVNRKGSRPRQPARRRRRVAAIGEGVAEPRADANACVFVGYPDVLTVCCDAERKVERVD